MALIRAHTSTKAADVAKLLLLNERLVTRPPTQSVAVPNCNATLSPTLM